MAEEWKNTKIATFLDNFCADDIYNADETGLYYRATPDGSLCYKHIELSGYKKAMDRITVLCCANMSGTDKRKLLVIGKSAKPRCFKGIRIENLPLEYHANKNAWMTSEIFRKWLTSWDAELQVQQRKIMLLVDNCAAHPHLDNLQNIKLEFLPSNTTSLVQPLDMGIIKNLKTLYRGKLVNYIVESIDDNLLTSSSTARDISAKINLLQAIQFLTDSWRAIKIKTIQNCFAVSGFSLVHALQNLDETESGVFSQVTSENLNETESDLSSQVTIGNYQEFLTIDNNLPCYDETENYENAIIQGIQSTRQILDEDSDADDENLPVPVTNQEARKCITMLQRYFIQEGNDESPMSALDTCADFVQKQSYKHKRQTILHEFFNN